MCQGCMSPLGPSWDISVACGIRWNVRQLTKLHSEKVSFLPLGGQKINICTPQFSSLATYCSLPSTTLNTAFVEREEYDFHYLKLSAKSFEGTFGELDTCSLDFVKQKGCVSFLPEETQWWMITARVAGLMAEWRETGAVGTNHTSAHSRTRVSEFPCGSSWTDGREPIWSHVHSYLRALPKRKMWHAGGLPEVQVLRVVGS